MQGKRILLGVTGGIAAYKSPDLVRRLRERGAEVQVVMTAAAREFVTATTFQAVPGRRCAAIYGMRPRKRPWATSSWRAGRSGSDRPGERGLSGAAGGRQAETCSRHCVWRPRRRSRWRRR